MRGSQNTIVSAAHNFFFFAAGVGQSYRETATVQMPAYSCVTAKRYIYIYTAAHKFYFFFTGHCHRHRKTTALMIYIMRGFKNIFGFEQF